MSELGDHTQCLTLDDGRVVEIRPLEREDRDGLAGAVSRLSEQTRYLRFASSKPRLTNRELDYLLDVDHHSREALLAIDPETRRGVAVVRYVEVGGEPRAVEIAATVADEWQGHGLGGALLVRLARRAREEGYAALRASVLAGNRRSIAMLLGAGFKPYSGGGIMREYELSLAPKAPSRGSEDPTPVARPSRYRVSALSRAAAYKCAERQQYHAATDL